MPIELEYRPTNIVTLLHKSIALNSMLAKNKNISISVQVEPKSIFKTKDSWENDIITCILDASRFEQVLNNLLR